MRVHHVGQKIPLDCALYSLGETGAGALRTSPIISCFPDFLIMISFPRWQMIAGEPQGSPEESPNTKRQRAAQKARARFSQGSRDGKCHRKHTAGRRRERSLGKGEKAR